MEDREYCIGIFEYIGLNDDQIDLIIDSKFKDNTLIFDDSRQLFLYDFCGKVKKYGIQRSLEYISYLKDLPSWKDELYLTHPDRTLEDINQEKYNFRKDQIMPSLKGLIKCRRCGSDNILEKSKVYRADEEAIIQLFCMTCKSKIR